MTDMYQIRVGITMPIGGAGVSTWYASAGDNAIGDVLDPLNSVYGTWATNHAASTFSFTVPATVGIIDSTTGELTGTTTHGTDTVHLGAAAAGSVPFVSQVLAQFETGFFVSGRQLRGRIFFPGCVPSDTDAGTVADGLISDMTDELNTSINDVFAVYSPTHRTWATINNSTIWKQFASLRSRRD